MCPLPIHDVKFKSRKILLVWGFLEIIQTLFITIVSTDGVKDYEVRE